MDHYFKKEIENHFIKNPKKHKVEEISGGFLHSKYQWHFGIFFLRSPSQ
jgi:hypothetical protein